jgi:hypothetical protein
MWGLGDNIYARPFVKELARTRDVYLETPWPEIYSELDIKFVRPAQRPLRTQLKNIARHPTHRWTATLPQIYPSQRWTISYGGRMPFDNIPIALQRCFNIRANWRDWDLPDWGLPCPVQTDRPIAVVRPVTVRREWFNSARNPKPEYVGEIAGKLMATHHVVSVADCDPTETLVLPAPPCHVKLHNGELSVEQLLTLARHADILLGGVGWIVPAAIALKLKAFVILGGHGAHNAPAIITDPTMDLTRLFFAKPEKFCQCTNMRHDCNKTIPDLMEQFCRFLDNRHCMTLSPSSDYSGFPNSELAISQSADRPTIRPILTGLPDGRLSR